MTEPFSFQDRRGRRTSATRGGVVLTPPPSSEVANAHNRSLTAQMNRSKLASGQRTAANLQMALPKTRQPLGSLMDKGIPFNTEDPKELSEARKLCNTPDAPVWMGDYSFKPIGEILPGEEVIGWVTEEQEFSRWGKSTHTRRKRILVKSTVLAVNRRMAPEVVKITFESGKTIKCTPDHEWLRYYPPNADGYITNGGPGNIERSWSKRYDSDYAPLQVGSVARFVMGQTEPLTDPEKLSAAHYLAGIIDGEGCWRNSTITFAQSRKVNPGVVERIDQAIETLGLSTYRYERVDHKPNNLGYQQKDFIVWDLSRSVGKTFSEACTDSIRIKNRQQLVDLYNWTHPAKMDIERMDKALLSSRFGVPDTVVSIESLGPGEVVSMQTTTGNYTAWGYASKNCRLYYRTHDLVPLLIDIYAKFPVVGLEFQCLAAETQVVTSEGTRPIGELSGGVHRILTTGGKWVEAPFKSFGEQPLMRLVVQRNGRQREFFATPNHRWLVQKVDINKNYCREEIHTSDLKPGMKLAPSYGRNIIHASNPSPFGIAHGMTFGDGSRNTSGGGCHVDLYGEKDFNMLQYFSGCTIYRGYRKDVSVDGVRVNDLPRFFKDRPALTESTSYLYGWLAGYFAADGTVSKKGECFLDSSSLSNLEYVRDVCHVLGIHTSDIYSYDREDGALPQGTCRGPHTLHRLRFANESLTEKFFCIPQHRDRWKEYAGRKSMEVWQVVSVGETDRVEEVYCAVVPGTEAFTLDGNILTGNSKDPLIEKFYSEMFLNDLNYEEFLPDLGREFFMVGEVNALAHFNEELGIWSSEEIIDPDMIRVSKSLFVQQERVQLLVKDMVERLRSGPDGAIDPDESPSERMERNKEYAELVKYYPEIIKAAAQDDGLDISDALISRIVNRANPNDVRGTPHLMRSFRTLMMEESLNAAQDAVADRLYAPLILATLGLPNLGDGEPWIPSPADLDDVRDDLQAALAADFKLMVHNLGLQVQNVFGRESVPRFDQDYQRIDSKLLQAWGIGEALIAGGTTGTYASSALNREVCEQLMFSFQNKIRRHIMKRCEVIAEAQQHYDFELKGGVRRPLYREIVEEDPETGEQYIRRVPKLLLPEIHFSTLNLRDESTERAFIAQLKAAGVPVSDKMMAVNLPLDFEQELERSANETVQKMVAQAQAMQKVQKLCDAQGLPYPPELATELTATLQLRQQLAQTDLMEDQAKMSELQTKQMTAPAAAGMGMLPGVPPPPPPEEEGGEKTAATTTTKPPGLPHATGPNANAPHIPGPPMPDPVELPRNRIRPPESDEQRKNQPKTSAVNGEEPRKLSAFEIGPSSYGLSRRASEADVERAVKRLEVISKHVPNPRVEDLIDDPEFYQALNATAYEDQIRADFPEVVAGGAGDSKKILDDLLEQYSEVFGIEPVW